MPKTLANVRETVRQRADIENSNVMTDAELTNEINLSLGTLRDMLINAFGADMFVSTTPQTINLVNGTKDYALSAGTQKVVGVDYNTGGYSYVLEIFSLQERNDFQNLNISPPNNFTYRYRIIGNSIRIRPTPTSGTDTLSVWYIPELTELSNDADEIPDLIESQWLEWLILDVAIKAKIKQDLAFQQLLLRQQQIENKIKDAAENRMFEQRLTVPTNNQFAISYPPRWRYF